MDTSNPVIEGMMVAMQLKHAMQQASLQREELARRKARDKREDDLTNFSSGIALMDKGAKPLAPGQQTVPQNIQMPSETPYFDPATGTPSVQSKSVPTQAPVDPNRTVTQPGTGQQFYIPTQDELFADSFGRHMQQLQAESNVKTQAEASKLFTQFALERGIHDMDNASRQGIAQLNTQAQDIREKGRQKTQKEIADAQIKSRETISDKEEKGRNSRTAYVQGAEDARQSVGEEGKNKRSKAGITENSRLSKIESLRREAKDLGEEEQKLHTARLQDGGENAGGTKDRFSSVAAREGAVNGAGNRIKVIQQRQDEIQRSLKLLDRSGTTADNPFRGGAVANPYR